MPAPEPLYVKEAEAARMLRHDVSWLRQNAPTLEAQYGFPKIDPAIGMRHREAIEEWARERNSRRTRGSERLTEANRANPDAF
jgi:hypothetical protein